MQFNANELNIEKAKSDKENHIPYDLSWPPLYQDKSMITSDMAAYLLIFFFFFFFFNLQHYNFEKQTNNGKQQRKQQQRTGVLLEINEFCHMQNLKSPSYTWYICYEDSTAGGVKSSLKESIQRPRKEHCWGGNTPGQISVLLRRQYCRPWYESYRRSEKWKQYTLCHTNMPWV